jgi:hypothetical protein
MITGLRFLLDRVHRWFVARRLAYPSPAECAEVLQWVAKNLPAGSEAELTLPPGLAGLSRGGVVQAVRDRNSRTCVLLKRTIRWKGNFTGTLCCDKEIARAEIIRGDVKNADYLAIDGSIRLKELYAGFRCILI